MKREVPLSALEFNPFSMIGDEGFLVSAAGSGGSVGLMTGGWGVMGILWGEPVVTIYVRPSRKTFDYLNKADRFTLSFFPPEKADALRYCGSVSARDNPAKLRDSGLHEKITDGYVVYEEANLTFACRKLYAREMSEGLVMDSSIVERYYSGKDVHWSFTGRIERVLI